jgi:hypothetical protein
MRAATVGAATIAALPACGQAGQQRERAHSSPRPTAARPAGAPIGKTLHIKTADTRLAVTVRKVIDPLRNSGALVDPGSRAIGVLLQVRNVGTGVYDSSSKSDLSVVSKGGAEAASAYASKGRCATPEIDFLRQLGSGSSGEGCVVFSLDKGEAVGRVRFKPHGQGKALTWVPRG